MKHCKHCNDEFSHDDNHWYIVFNKTRGKSYLLCRKTQLDRRRKRPPTYEKQRAWDLQRNYGMTQNDFDLMLKSQNDQCAICGSTKWGGRHNTPCVDHDHATGQIRGLLCHSCNLILGHAKDNHNVLLAATVYLSHHATLNRV